MADTAHVFDAYGTLFDVHAAVRRHAAAVGPAAERLSLLWRDKQLEYSWVHALMEDYVPFWELTRRALDFALRELDVDPVHAAPLLDAYRTLDAYPEVAAHLTALKGAGTTTAILSNGSPDMLAAAVASAGLETYLDHVLSVDAVRAFKTDRRTYALVTDALDLSPSGVTFHSSNRWDVAGAARFGFRTVWVNRAGRTDEYPGHPPDRTVRSLAELG